MIIKLIDGIPQHYTLKQLRLDNPDVSFRRDYPAEQLAQFGVYYVTETPMPAETVTHYPVAVLPTLQGTEWVQTWEMVAYTPEELLVRDAEKQLQAEAAADSPTMQAAINVFTQIILAGEKPDVATVRQRVVNEIKTKLGG